MDESTARAAFACKVRRGIFAPVERHLSERARADDRLQEAIAMTWDLYRRHALEGRVLDDALLVHHCRLRAIDTRRTFVPGERRRRGDDVLNPRAYTAGKADVVSLEDLGRSTRGRYNPEREVHSALDLRGWMDELVDRDVVIVEGKLMGKTLGEIADEIGMSISGTLRRARMLGKELAGRMALA